MVEKCEIVIMMKKIDKENKAIIGIGIVIEEMECDTSLY